MKLIIARVFKMHVITIFCLYYRQSGIKYETLVSQGFHLKQVYVNHFVLNTHVRSLNSINHIVCIDIYVIPPFVLCYQTSICQINRTLADIYNLFIRFYNVNINTHNSKKYESDHAKKAGMSEYTGEPVQLLNSTTGKVVYILGIWAIYILTFVPLDQTRIVIERNVLLKSKSL